MGFAPGEWLTVAVAKGLIRAEDLLPRPTPVVTTAPPAELPADLCEKAFQARVIELAESNGWRVYHTRDSRGSNPGWPDLAIVRTGRLLLCELKTNAGRVRPEQQEWIDLLGTIRGIEVYVWRPRDWSLIHQELTRAG